MTQDPDHLDVGAAFLYLGSTNGPGSSYNWMAYGSEEYSWFGHSVSTAGDTNRDGFSDILIGAYLLGQNGEENQPNEGAAYLFIGGASGPS